MLFKKKNKGNKKPIAYQLKLIDSFRHMQQSLSNLVGNLTELNKNIPDVLINRFYNLINFVIMTLLNISFHYEKVSIHMNIWTHGKNLMSLCP